MSTWSSLSAEERKSVLENVAGVYRKHGNPEWLKPLEVYTEKVNILMAGQQQEQQRLTVEGKCSPEQKELAEQISKDMKQALEPCKDSAKVGIRPSYDVGQQLPVLKNVNKVMEEGTADVQHNEGEVLFVDFWATWCGYCLQPMAHNQKMLEENAEKWGGKVRFVCLSIDQGVAAVKNKVQQSGWTSLEHYQIVKEDCTVKEDFEVRGVPNVMLVDTKGKIVFRGHPAHRKDIVDDLNKLLAGETIEVEAKKEEEQTEENSQNKKVDSEAAQVALDKFFEESKQLMDSNPDAFKFPRAFLVVTDEAKLNMETSQLEHSLTCYTQLMGGDAEKQETAKGLLKNVNQGPWKNVDTFRV